MPTGHDNVRFRGKTGSRRPTAKLTRLTHLGHWVAAFGVDWLPFLTLRPSQSVRLEASKRFSLRVMHATARVHHAFRWHSSDVAARSACAATGEDEAHRDSCPGDQNRRHGCKWPSALPLVFR